jgi:hypothetical protein
MGRAKDRTGIRYGRLTAVQQEGIHKRSGNAQWLCECDCGGTKIVRSSSLQSGNTRSCGCLGDETRSVNGKDRTLHGYSKTADGRPSIEYIAWSSAKYRCHCPTNPKFEQYGGRGITMCDEWRNDFQAFYDHIGPKPSPELSLDRIDNDGNYEPGNVRWATASEQRYNQRSKSTRAA